MFMNRFFRHCDPLQEHDGDHSCQLLEDLYCGEGLDIRRARV